MFDEETIEYIVDAVQSPAAIQRQIDGGTGYFTLTLSGKHVAYIAFKTCGDGLFLSKLYASDSERGRGLGRKVMDHLEVRARALGARRINPGVYRDHVAARTFYKHMGLRVAGSVDRNRMSSSTSELSDTRRHCDQLPRTGRGGREDRTRSNHKPGNAP